MFLTLKRICGTESEPARTLKLRPKLAILTKKTSTFKLRTIISLRKMFLPFNQRTLINSRKTFLALSRTIWRIILSVMKPEALKREVEKTTIYYVDLRNRKVKDRL